MLDTPLGDLDVVYVERAHATLAHSSAVVDKLEPDVWFQNTEYAALRIVGQETVRYVANIYKYYIAYSLSRNLLQQRLEQLETIKSTD
jgi:hypothetical protein